MEFFSERIGGIMEDFLKGRQIPEGMEADEVDKLALEIKNVFDTNWINQKEKHPIRNLLKRKDYISTCELFTLANAMNQIRKIDSVWLDGQLKKIKSNNINNINGALFEVIGFSYLLNDGYKLELASEGNPGIDGAICFDGDIKVNISMKNYRISHFEKDFNNEMDDLKKYLVKLLAKNKILTCQCGIDFKKYPSHTDFIKVKKFLDKGINELKKGNLITIHDDVADIIFRVLRYRKFASGTQSYTLLAESPLHKNEFKNLVDKLEDACDNLVKQKKVEDKNEINGIWIHVHENAEIKKCQEFLQEYLNNNSQKPISFINLYGPCVTRELEDNSTQITHIVMPVTNPVRYTNWIKENGINIPIFTFFVGNTSMKQSQRKLFIDDDEYKTLENSYFYQSGEIYVEAETMPDGSIEGDIVSEAPGVKVNTVINIDGKSMIISGKFPEDEHLEIL